MSIVAHILAYVVLVLFLFASTNALKRYTKNTLVRRIASYHKIFGMLAGATALANIVVNLVNHSTSTTGLIAMVMVMATGAIGASFKVLKNKKLYVAHRIVGPLTLLAIVLHLVL